MKPCFKINLYCCCLWAILQIACQSHSSNHVKQHNELATITHTKAPVSLTIHTPHIPKELLQEKTTIDSLAKNTTQLLVMVKVPNNKKLVTINKGDKFPEEIETTYNIIKDKAGRIIYTVEIPYSESGDWFIAYKSYYRTTGQLFAFERQTGFFNGECSVPAEEPLHERSVKYFDRHMQLIDSTYEFKDNKGKLLKKPDCVSSYNYPYTVSKSADEFIRRNHMQL